MILRSYFMWHTVQDNLLSGKNWYSDTTFNQFQYYTNIAVLAQFWLISIALKIEMPISSSLLHTYPGS